MSFIVMQGKDLAYVSRAENMSNIFITCFLSVTSQRKYGILLKLFWQGICDGKVFLFNDIFKITWKIMTLRSLKPFPIVVNWDIWNLYAFKPFIVMQCTHNFLKQKITQIHTHIYTNIYPGNPNRENQQPI
jgi:hypothetical protein